MKKWILEVTTQDNIDKQTLQTLLGNLLLVSSQFREINKILGIKIKEIVN